MEEAAERALWVEVNQGGREDAGAAGNQKMPGSVRRPAAPSAPAESFKSESGALRVFAAARRMRPPAPHSRATLYGVVVTVTPEESPARGDAGSAYDA